MKKMFKMIASNSLILLAVLLSLMAIARSWAAPAINLEDPAQVQRLRQMFDRGQTQAINDFYEQKALKAITTNSSQGESAVHFIPLSMVDPNHKLQADVVHYLMVKPVGQAPAKEEETQEDRQPAVSNSTHHDEHLKSDARQSPFFGGLGNASPFGNGFLRPPQFPTLPPIPTLPPFRPFGTQPSRPPKSSIIGNSGGAMALTNDNVVVVNVLSGNY